MVYPNQLYEDVLSELKKSQEVWFETTSKEAVSALIRQGCNEREVLKQFEITFDEKKYGSRFLLKDDLIASGFSVEPIEGVSDSYSITISKENQY